MAASKSLLIAAMLTGLLGTSYQVEARVVDNQSEAQANVFSQAQLEQMLAPIALYPDTLLTHILIAATYPIEVIDADRLIKKHDGYTDREITRLVDEQDWDPSVKALTRFPNIIEKLSTDLTWMRNLGDAFLQDEEQVLASVQSLRKRADIAGNLAQMDNVDIVREKKTIIIEPRESEVVYVPYYDTRVVYGDWRWRHYPPVYWHRPVHYSYYHGPFYWRSGVDLALDFFFVGLHWHHHKVVHKHYKSRYHWKTRYHRHKRITTSHEVKRWVHNPHRRKGVAYRTPAVKKRYASYQPSYREAKSVRVKEKNSYSYKNVHRTKEFSSSKHEKIRQSLKVNQAVKVSKHREKHVAPVTHLQAKHRTKSQVHGIKSRDIGVIKHDKVSRKHLARERTEYRPIKREKARRESANYKVHTSERKKHYTSKIKSRERYTAQGGHKRMSHAKVARGASNHKSMKSSSRHTKHH